MILGIIYTLMMFYCISSGINYGCKRGTPKDFGIIDMVYRIIRVIGCVLMLKSSTVIVGVALFIIANWIKTYLWNKYY